MTDDHEHYRELCAEDAAGRLSESDWVELQQHLGNCSQCQQLSREFVSLSMHVIPRVGELCGEKRRVNPHRKAGLLKLAEAEGLTRTPERSKQLELRWFTSRRAALCLVWMASVVVAVLATVVVVKHSQQSDNAGLLADRNVHLLSIFPRDPIGNPTTEFGRLFFVEGKRLEFYAFNLSEPKGLGTTGFYVWGESGQRDKAGHPKIILLGKFKLDGVKDRRWSLVVGDPNALRGLRSVFVTVESVGSVTGPTGRRMLFAPLDVLPPNRP